MSNSFITIYKCNNQIIVEQLSLPTIFSGVPVTRSLVLCVYCFVFSCLSFWRNPPTMDKQLVNFITCGCQSSAPFFVIYKAGREPTP